MGSSHQVWQRVRRSDRCFQCNSQRFSAGFGKKGRHGLRGEPRDVAGEVETASSHTDQVLFELLIVNVKSGRFKERPIFEGSAQAKARDHRVDSNLREHHTEFAFEHFTLFEDDGALLNLDATAHDLSRNAHGVQVSNNGAGWHTGVLLLNHDLVRRDVTRFGGTTSFGLLEFRKHLKRVEG